MELITDFCGVTVALAVTETLAGYSHKDTIITIAGRRQQLPRHDTVKGDTPKKRVWTKGSEAADRSYPKKTGRINMGFFKTKDPHLSCPIALHRKLATNLEMKST